jgi:hypothetical protein
MTQNEKQHLAFDKPMPIWDHRMIVGYARTRKQAEKILKKEMNIHPLFNLKVFKRDTDLIDLPAGWVYAISYPYK